MMKKVISTLLGSILCTALIAQDSKVFFTTEYTSLTVPELYHGELSYLDPATLKTKFVKTGDLVHDKTLLPSLSAAISAVTIFKQDVGGELTIAGQSLSAKDQNYVVIYDFTQTQQVSVPQADGSVISGLIGVAVRMTARIHTKKKGINLANLFGVGLAATQDRLTGSLEVKVFGMSSQKINEVIPVTSDLSTATIQNCLSSVATIKSHIYDDDTRITPLWLAYSVTGTKDSKTKQSAPKEYKSISNEIKTFQQTK